MWKTFLFQAFQFSQVVLIQLIQFSTDFVYTVKCQNSSISKKSAEYKYISIVKKQVHFR